LFADPHCFKLARLGMTDRKRIVRGDWQTPSDLADLAVARALACLDFEPASLLEPTCGVGAFLEAAVRRLPAVAARGYEIDRAHAEVARRRLGSAARVEVADFFAMDWEGVFSDLPGPPLVLGNPPWVTSATLGVLDASNAPRRSNFKAHRGLDALTGKGNFDVSEWMILRLLAALSETGGALAMLCKSSVARRVIEFTACREGWSIQPGGLWRIDASAHFDAAVDAVLLVCRTSASKSTAVSSWPLYPSLDAEVPEAVLGVRDGIVVADLEGYAKTRHLAGVCEPQWRSGLKHDCARVMELRSFDGQWRNGNGDIVDIEPDYRFPLLKSSDLAGVRGTSSRAVIVPQRTLGEDTADLVDKAPKLWRYLEANRHALNGRKSSIYRGQPPYSVFGVGLYTFAPWKIAISGLYKRLSFTLVGPRDGRPVILDDTCYFLPFTRQEDARRALSALTSDLATAFFESRIFWDAKRPINKAVLQAFDLVQMLRESAGRGREAAGLIGRS
jgi:hypothetical protein